MRHRSRGFALAVAAVVATAGCTAQAGKEDPAAWAGQQEHVAAAEMVAYDDPSQGKFLSITLDDHLPDLTVKDVVHGVKQHFDDDTDAPSIDVDVDGFVGSVFPGLVTFGDGVSDPELDRALWLRSDGRATSYADSYHSTVSSHPRVIAPAADVAQLAIDFDAAVTHAHDVRGSRSVESADGTTAVEWATAETLGFGLDPDVVGEFARLQKTYPGTTGWLTSDGITWKAFVDFARDDVTLADVMGGALLDTSLFTELDLGWGPARAEAGQFAPEFGDPGTRALLDAVGGVDGVTEIGEDGVVVLTGAAFARVFAYTAGIQDGPRVSLRRAPVRYDEPVDPVFKADHYDPASILAVYTAVADLPGILEVDTNEASDFGNLTVDREVTPAELATVFASLAALPAPYARTEVYTFVPGDYGHEAQVSVGTADADGFTTTGRFVSADLGTRVEQAWDDARSR